jgi:hypothetical protein
MRLVMVASAAVDPPTVKSAATKSTAMKSTAKPHAMSKSEAVEIVETVSPKDAKSNDHVGG